MPDWMLGEVSESVEVSAAAARVNTTIANLGQVIDNKTIVSLPNLAAKSDGLHLPHARRRRLGRASR